MNFKQTQYSGYLISDTGDLVSVRPINGRGALLSFCEAKSLKKRISNCGYARYALSIGSGKYGYVSAHRLVAESFVSGKTNERCFVNHKNGDKLDNRADNLEWVTASQNILHSRRTLRKCIGELHGMAKLTKKIANEIRSSDESVSSLALKYGVSKSTIERVRNGKCWKHDN